MVLFSPIGQENIHKGENGVSAQKKAPFAWTKGGPQIVDKPIVSKEKHVSSRATCEPYRAEHRFAGKRSATSEGAS
jgi:hypothetical protein